MLLGLSAGVGRMALLIEASLVDDAKGAPVVAFDMDALDALVRALVQMSLSYLEVPKISCTFAFRFA